jgi:hypothetical protein
MMTGGMIDLSRNVWVCDGVDDEVDARRHPMILSRLTIPFVVVSPIFIGVAGLAQTPAQDSAAGPSVRLSEAQMQTIYQSITKTQKNDPAPTGFRAAVGTIVPGSITVMPVPGSVAELIPQTKGFDVARVEGQVMLVDPKSREVLSVVTQQQ